MIRARSLALAVGFVALVASALPAWQWPVAITQVTKTFGEDAGGYLMRGVELGGGAQPVYPVESGVVVESVAEDSAIPSGLGAYVVIDHDQAFRSIYAHLDTDSLPNVGQRVDTTTQIGTVGESGLVQGRALRLSIIDLENGQYVNPMLLLPDLPDAVRPAIGAVYARSSNALYDLRRTTELPMGTYEITAELDDRISTDRSGATVAPYHVSLFVAGQESFSIGMDRLEVADPQTMLEPGGHTAPDLYGVAGVVRLGSVTVGAGRTEVEIVAADFAGNESTWQTNLQAAQ